MLVQPGSPYASSKMALEAYAQSFSECYGMGITSLRFFNVYGPRQDPTSPYSGVISIFLSRAVGNGEVTVFGDGSQTRDFVFVGDICQAIEKALAKQCVGANVFNVATGSSVTLNELIETIGEVSGRSLEATYAEFRAGEIIHSSADISAIQRGLGYQPTVALRDGLRRTFEWCSASLVEPNV
jgi:UDP-glucose 4-epimerase